MYSFLHAILLFYSEHFAFFIKIWPLLRKRGGGLYILIWDGTEFWICISKTKNHKNLKIDYCSCQNIGKVFGQKNTSCFCRIFSFKGHKKMPSRINKLYSFSFMFYIFSKKIWHLQLFFYFFMCRWWGGGCCMHIGD